LLTDEHGMQGFATLNGDLLALSQADSAGASGIINTENANAASLNTALSNNNSSLIAAISNGFRSNGFTGNVNVTNMPTNFPDQAAISNTAPLVAAANPTTNWQAYLLTGPGVAGLTGLGSNLYSSSGLQAGVSNYGAVVNDFGIPTNTGAGTGGDGYVVTLGNDASGAPLTLSIGLSYLPSGLQATLAACKFILGLMCCFMGFVFCMGETGQAMDSVFLTPQIEGNKSSILGTNAATDIPTGLAYAGIAFALIAVIPAVMVTIAGTFASGGGGWGNFATELGVLAASPAWIMGTAIVPVDTAAWVIATCILFKYVLVQIPLRVAQSVKMAMVS